MIVHCRGKSSGASKTKDQSVLAQENNNVVDIAPEWCSPIKQTPLVSFLFTMTAILAVLFFMAVWTAKGADGEAGDKTQTATGYKVKPRQNPQGSSDPATPRAADRAGERGSPSKKKDTQSQTPPKIPYVYGPNAGASQSNYREAQKLEKDVGRNMRGIDNAIRQMNIDINRIRTLERRF